jgi:cation diffusion facilitator family transporter
MSDGTRSAAAVAGGSSAAQLTETQRQHESALVRAILLDFVMYVSLIVAAVLSGSLTVLAELPRATLLYSVEIIAWITLRRSNRGKLAAFEYGIGKIERVIMIVIAGGLIASAIFTFDATLERLSHPTVLPTPALVLAVIVATANLVVNAYCTGEFVRANASEENLIFESQVRSRMVKTAASAVVVVVLVVATWLADPKAATYVDAFGAIFVIGYMIATSVGMLRESLPDLLDRALPEHEQLIILRVIAQNFDDFEHFGSVRSRRSGGHAFIDISLSFDPDMPLQVVSHRCSAIVLGIREAIPDAIVRVDPRCC